MMKCPVPLLLLLLLGVIDPIGSNTGIGQLLAQGGPNNPPPEPPQPIDPPTITSQSTSAFITPGTDVTFEVVAEGNGPLDYQWFFNGSSIRNERKQQLTIRNFQADEVGTYFVVVSNPGGFVRSANINPTLRQERSTGIGFQGSNRFSQGFIAPTILSRTVTEIPMSSVRYQMGKGTPISSLSNTTRTGENSGAGSETRQKGTMTEPSPSRFIPTVISSFSAPPMQGNPAREPPPAISHKSSSSASIRAESRIGAPG